MTQLEDLVTAFLAPRAGATFGAEDLRRLWTDLVGDGPAPDLAAEVVEDAFLEAAARALPDGPVLQVRPGGWVVHVSGGLVRAALSAAIVAGLLALGGYEGLPAALAPAVIPLLFEIRKVRLERGEQQLHALLGMRAEFREGQRTPREIYDALPTEVRDRLSPIDFTTFLDTCWKAGLLDKAEGGRVAVRRAEEQRFRVTIE